MRRFIAIALATATVIGGGYAQASNDGQSPYPSPSLMPPPPAPVQEEIPVLLSAEGEWICQHGDVMEESASQEYLEQNLSYYYTVLWVNLVHGTTDKGETVIQQSIEWLDDNLPEDYTATDALRYAVNAQWITKQIEKIQKSQNAESESKSETTKANSESKTETSDTKANLVDQYAEHGIKYWEPKCPNWEEMTDDEIIEYFDSQPEPPEDFDMRHPGLYFDRYGFACGKDNGTGFYYATPSGDVYELSSDPRKSEMTSAIEEIQDLYSGSPTIDGTSKTGYRRVGRTNRRIW